MVHGLSQVAFTPHCGLACALRQPWFYDHSWCVAVGATVVYSRGCEPTHRMHPVFRKYARPLGSGTYMWAIRSQHCYLCCCCLFILQLTCSPRLLLQVARRMSPQRSSTHTSQQTRYGLISHAYPWSLLTSIPFVRSHGVSCLALLGFPDVTVQHTHASWHIAQAHCRLHYARVQPQSRLL